jgi:hypothetical protein
MAALKIKPKEIVARLKQFIVHDVRKNRILGLYLVIGVMVVSYGIYFIFVMYKDISTGGDKRVASKPKVEQARKKPPPKKKPPVKKKAAVPAKKKETPEQAKPEKVEPEKEKVAATAKSAAAQKLDTSKWKSLEFPDGSYISFPPDWSSSEVDSEKNVLYGIRLQAPGSEASLKCYSRSRKLGDNYTEYLTETLKRGGYTRIKEEAKKISRREVAQISGTLADKRMVISVFDDQPDKYFIVRLIAPKQELAELQSYYDAIVGSYGDTSVPDTSVVSIEKLEQQLEESIEDDKEFLVGSTVWIKLKSGARHKGVVIAEDDASLTIESFRFGGRYSFTVKKDDIVEIIR